MNQVEVDIIGKAVFTLVAVGECPSGELPCYFIWVVSVTFCFWSSHWIFLRLRRRIRFQERKLLIYSEQDSSKWSLQSPMSQANRFTLDATSTRRRKVWSTLRLCWYHDSGDRVGHFRYIHLGYRAVHRNHCNFGHQTTKQVRKSQLQAVDFHCSGINKF